MTNVTLSQQIAEQEARKREAQQIIEARKAAQTAPEQALAEAEAQLTFARQQQREQALHEAASQNAAFVERNREAVGKLFAAFANTLTALRELKITADEVHATFDAQQEFVLESVARYMVGRFHANAEASAAYDRFANALDGLPVVNEWVHDSDTPEEAQLRQSIMWALYRQFTDTRISAQQLTEREVMRRRQNAGRGQ